MTWKILTIFLAPHRRACFRTHINLCWSAIFGFGAQHVSREDKGMSCHLHTFSIPWAMTKPHPWRWKRLVAIVFAANPLCSSHHTNCKEKSSNIFTSWFSCHVCHVYKLIFTPKWERGMSSSTLLLEARPWRDEKRGWSGMLCTHHWDWREKPNQLFISWRTKQTLQNHHKHIIYCINPWLKSS